MTRLLLFTVLGTLAGAAVALGIVLAIPGDQPVLAFVLALGFGAAGASLGIEAATR